MPKARKKRRSSSGSASSLVGNSKKKAKKGKEHNNSNDNDLQMAATNHERIPEVVVKKVYVSYFESTIEERGGRNDM